MLTETEVYTLTRTFCRRSLRYRLPPSLAHECSNVENVVDLATMKVKFYHSFLPFTYVS
jgi:hypothetical protein